MEVTVPVVINIDFIKINNLIGRAMKNIGNAIRNTFIRMNKNDKELREDDLKFYTTELDKTTKFYNSKLDEIFSKKEKDLMSF